MIFTSQSSSEGRVKGGGCGARSGFANMFTNLVMLGSEGCRENGSFAASLMMSRAGQIIISHLNGNFLAIADRSADSVTFSRTTNVPTAPMFTTPNLANRLARVAGWHRLAPPTLTARRKTTRAIREVRVKKRELGSGK